MNNRPIRLHEARFVGVSEEPGWLLGANQNEVASTGEPSNGLVDPIRQERNRMPASSALDQAIKGWREKLGAGHRCNTMSVSQRVRLQSGTGYHQDCWFTTAQHARNVRNGGRCYL